MSKRQHEGFSQANSGWRMPQVASTPVQVAEVVSVALRSWAVLALTTHSNRGPGVVMTFDNRIGA